MTQRRLLAISAWCDQRTAITIQPCISIFEKANNFFRSSEKRLFVEDSTQRFGGQVNARINDDAGRRKRRGQPRVFGVPEMLAQADALGEDGDFLRSARHGGGWLREIGGSDVVGVGDADARVGSPDFRETVAAIAQAAPDGRMSVTVEAHGNRASGNGGRQVVSIARGVYKLLTFAVR